MKRLGIGRKLAMLLSLLLLLTSTVNTTYGFIVTQTEPLINTFIPFDSVVNNLLLNKTVEHPLGEGYVIPDTVSFDFEVKLGALYANTTIKTTDGSVVADENGTITVSVRPGKPVGIEDIDAGTRVTVTERQKDGSGFAVKDGAATKEVTVSAEGRVTVDYVNVYTPQAVRPVNVTVGGVKRLEGREWQTGDTFSFLLEQDSGGGEWVTLGTETITYDAENAAFNRFDFSALVQALTFDKVGTYAFRMTEVVGTLDHVSYDKTVNTFTVKVTDVDMDGKLEIGDVAGMQNVTVTENNGGFAVNVTFSNAFVPPAVPDPDAIAVTVTVNKTVKNTGTATIGPAGFEFVLENVTTGEKLALTSDVEGKALFTLPFTVKDAGKTYAYTLHETDGGVVGVTYDTAVYDIAVTVTLGEDDRLVAAVTVNGTAVDTPVVAFENTYKAEQPVSPPTGVDSHLVFWSVMMLASGATFVYLLLTNRKCEEKA